MPDHRSNSSSDLKLPSGPAARRRRHADKNEWTAIDKAAQRRPVLALIFIGIILAAGIALIIRGFA